MAMTVLFSQDAGHPLLACCLVLLSLGTGGGGSGKGDLSCKVSYNGKPLALGSVLLFGVDNKPKTTWIEADGSYRFVDVPVGEAKLAVYSPDPAKQLELSRKKSGPNGTQGTREEPVAPALPA